jgi:hypothetical protein
VLKTEKTKPPNPFKQAIFIFLWERHLAAILSRLEATPTKKSFLADKVALRVIAR